MAEGLGILYDLAGTTLSLLGPRGRMQRHRVFKKAVEQYSSMLETLKSPGVFLDEESLVRLNLLKPKHYMYANYLAMFGSQALLPKYGARHLLKAILAKASMGVGTKVMDNINDEWQTSEEAYRCVGRLESALINGRVELARDSSVRWIDRAVNSALEMTAWAGCTLEPLKDLAHFSYGMYCDDVSRWVAGQQDSLVHRSRSVTLDDYLTKVMEKGTGSLWSAPDLIVLESRLGGFDSEQRKKALAVRNHCDHVIKSCLLYDDIADFTYDVETDSVNAVIILARERGIIGNKRSELEKPVELYQHLHKEGIVDEILTLGDLMFARAMALLENISYEDSLIDRATLVYGSRLLRIFNLRKVLIRDKNLHALRTCLETPSGKDVIHLNIPPMALGGLITGEGDSATEFERFPKQSFTQEVKASPIVHSIQHNFGTVGYTRVIGAGLAREVRTNIYSGLMKSTAPNISSSVSRKTKIVNDG